MGAECGVTSGHRLRIEVLGPVRVIDADGRDLTPTGALQRRLLALLALRRGRVVPSDTAVEVLWPSDLPHDPAGALQNHLSRLRRDLPDGVIHSVGDGYRLDASQVDLDCDELATAVSADPPLDPPTLARIESILDRWQGPAFPELDHADEIHAEALRLADLRVRAQEVRAEHRLATGDTDGLVADLSTLTELEPLRERPRSLLMAALAADGRQVEALRVYDDFRRLLSDELGIEPSPALMAQHAALLEGGSVGSPRWSPPQGLPTPTTSLVGRSRQAAELAALVEARRLVSLIGPGGVGKTRLLVEVGHLLRAASPERPVVLCELATADEASAVNVMAAALGVDARPGVALADQLATVLGPTELVVLADNCEHVLEPIAELVDHLLTRCPRLTVVATSRERLRVAGEQTCSVGALPVEGPASPAVRLFLDRARAAVADFEPTDDELAVIEDLVRRLDGLPLAIELAAARLFTHDLDEVAAGLDQRFALLTSGYRTSPRHASLGAAVSWSFDMLDPDLQDVFAALSVFAGSFTAADAASVCLVPLDEAQAALAELAERSLVMRAPHRRFVLLETLRAFGAERLDASGQRVEVGHRHARRLVEWIEDADDQLLVPGRGAIAEIDAALPELHAAFTWLVAQREAELAGRMVASLLDYGVWRLRPDVLAWSERAAALDPDDRCATAAVVWAVAAYAAWMTGDVPETGRRAAKALAIAVRHGGPMPGEVATVNGSYQLFVGDLDEARRWYRLGIEVAGSDRAQQLMARASEFLALGYADDPATDERIDALLSELGAIDTANAAYAWYCAGEADLARGLPRAESRLEQAIELAARANASFVTGIAGASKASIVARTGDPQVAAQEYRRLIDHWRRAGMWSTQWTMLRSIAGLLFRLDRHHQAAVLVGAVQGTTEGHRIFGADEAALDELEALLRSALGDGPYEEARNEGARLDGDDAVEHALRSLGGTGLGGPVTSEVLRQ
jgi:predicted ATPase/DNA-binding SARP family transcriptional activator